MKQNLVPGIVLILAVLSCGVGWLALPSLQDAQRTVDAEAAVCLERARRLLDRYNHGLTYKAELLDLLAEAGVDVDIEDPDDLIDLAGDEYQNKHGELWERYQPYDYDRPGRPGEATPRYGNLPRQVSDGIAERDRLLNDNENLLDEAFEEIEQALSINRGGARSGQYAEANRLEGVILQHMGVAERLRAHVLRRQADPYRMRLEAIGRRLAEAVSVETAVADSGIDEQIGLLQETATEATAKLNEDRKTLERIDDTISNLQRRLVAAEANRDRARETMEAIKRQGIDFSDPNAGEAFETRFLQQDRIYRDAAREAKFIEHGAYVDSHVAGNGGRRNGGAVEAEHAAKLPVRYGLAHYRDEQTVLAASLRIDEQALDDLRSDIARLEGIKNTYEAERDRKRERADEARTEADEVYAELNLINSEAFAAEERALEHFDGAIEASKVAASSAQAWVTAARDATQDLSSEAKSRSAYNPRIESGWMEGHIAAQQADGHLAKAWVYYQRYHAYGQNAKLLSELAGPLRLAEADDQAESLKASEAHDLGVEAITQAMGILEHAHRDGGSHWTFVAQQGGAYHLLALFGYSQYIDDAIQAYDNAVKGREEEEASEKFRVCLSHLERLKNQ